MHKNHLIGCGVGIALALGIVSLSGGAAGSVGVLAVVLLCPALMVGALWLLTRPTSDGAPVSQTDSVGDAVGDAVGRTDIVESVR